MTDDETGVADRRGPNVTWGAYERAQILHSSLGRPPECVVAQLTGDKALRTGGRRGSESANDHSGVVDAVGRTTSRGGGARRDPKIDDRVTIRRGECPFGLQRSEGER